jgi:hypothetical protein
MSGASPNTIKLDGVEGWPASYCMTALIRKGWMVESLTPCPISGRVLAELSLGSPDQMHFDAADKTLAYEAEWAAAAAKHEQAAGATA